jgi:hypothetical protein
MMLARRPGLPLRLADFHLPRPQGQPFTPRRRLTMSSPQSEAQGLIMLLAFIVFAPLGLFALIMLQSILIVVKSTLTILFLPFRWRQ